jgi:hypothetical protein
MEIAKHSRALAANVTVLTSSKASALAHYVAGCVASFTAGTQTPDMAVQFDTTIFAVGL